LRQAFTHEKLRRCHPKKRLGADMDYEVNQVEMKGEFKKCPSCDYPDGFHSMFKEEGDVTKWLFICPSCHMVFDIGFTV